MNRATHAPFESIYQTTNAWLKELMEELDWQDRHQAYRGLRAVLHALRNHLTVEETADLGAPLPMPIEIDGCNLFNSNNLRPIVCESNGVALEGGQGFEPPEG